MTHLDGDAIRHAFLSSADAALRLLRSPQVAAQWNAPSALDEWAVSGLAGHLGRAVLTVSRYLDGATPAPDTVTVDPAGYMLSAIHDDDLDVTSDLYTAIRNRGDQEGAQGVAPLVATVNDELSGLRRRLGRTTQRLDGTTLVEVLNGITMSLDDYLATRVVELVVHIDDLAVSVGVDADIPKQSLAVAVDVVVELGRRRRGDLTVLRAMARRERVPDGPLAF